MSRLNNVTPEQLYAPDMDISHLSPAELQKISALSEGHFTAFTPRGVVATKITEIISAFANADGGEIFVGIEQVSPGALPVWKGFKSVESATEVIAVVRANLQSPRDSTANLLSADAQDGLILHLEIAKNRDIINSSDAKIFVRQGIKNVLIDEPEDLERLRFNKGVTSFETMTVDAPADIVTNSDAAAEFIKQIVPQQTPAIWLRRQNLIVNDKPTVAGLILFADEPQAFLPKRCGIKIYRYRTADDEGTREALEGVPATVEGCAYRQVYAAVAATKQIIEGIRRMTPGGLVAVEYPEETLHEIITNAVLHRDYSIPDDIHIRVYDNRVEVESPGRLPGHITTKNILDERFARNGNIVRIINKFPNPPNKDVGEGLNTAFRAMQRLHLKDPDIIQRDSSVLVVIRHEQLASPEERIMGYLEKNLSISNGKARELCVIREDWRIRSIFSRMVNAGMIEKVPGSTTSNTAYQKKQP